MRASTGVLVAATVLQVAGAGGLLEAQAPPVTSGQHRLQVPYTEFTLGNGLHVILHRDASVPTVSVNVWYHVGSGSEKPGRTGFAHLFEHLMFEGSKNVPEGAFDQWLEAAGGNNNGSTTNDRTNYYIDVPSNALEMALFLESDRMGYLLDTMTPERVDGQRDVVKNERRQSYENQPYGRAFLTLGEMLYPKNHPYSWPTIGSMEDLTAATRDDVAEFFKTYYAPNNASLVVAGDIDIADARKLVEKWFSEIPRGPAVPPITPPAASLTEVKKQTLTDRVQLPRLYLAWHTPPLFAPGDAAMDVAASLMTGGKNSRLYRRLVYDMQIAQDVSAFQQSQALGSVFVIIATARPGQTLDKIQGVIDEELDKLRTAPADAREMARTMNQLEANFYRAMERVGGFGGKADQLNAYYTRTGMPDFFEEDLSRYRSLSAEDIRSAIVRLLPKDRRVELSIVPEAKQ
jgi:zinc protease